MKSLTKILLVVLLLTGINSAFADTQDRHLSGFHALSISASFDVYITQGSTESVKVNAPADIINRVITEVRGDELIVRSKSGSFNWSNLFNSHSKMAIYVTVKDLHSIHISGSSDVFFKNGINANLMELSISGSGNVLGRLNVKTFNCAITGSGDVKLSGTAQTATISISGSGDFHSGNLVTGTTMIRIAGSGDAVINANQKLDAHVSGSGDIRYTGGAKQVSTSTSGSGSIHRF